MKVFKCIVLFFAVFLVSGCTNTTSNFMMRNNNTSVDIYYAANKHIGLHEVRDRKQIKKLVGVDPVRTEWCAAFVNAMLASQDMPGSDSVSDYPLMARSFLYWGESVDHAQVGDIMVFSRGRNNWQGHVGFYIGTVNRNGLIYYKILGGNQNNSINITEYPANRLLGIRRIENPLQPTQGIKISLTNFFKTIQS